MPRLLPRLVVVLLAFYAATTIVRSADAIAPASATDASAVTPSLITASDLLKLKQVESPALSPDGKWVVYVVRSIEPKPEAKDDWVYHTNLWLAATDGKTPPRQLTRNTNSNTAPAWSPDGQRIAFARGGNAPTDKTQIYVLALEGGEAQQLTKSEFGAGTPRWSPDGSRILFTTTLNFAQVRDTLEKAVVDSKPKWNFEKPGRAAGDVGNWGLKSADKAKKDDKDAKRPTASPDGTLQERREWLAKNEADGNPRPLDHLNFLSETDINPDMTFGHLLVQEVREDAEAKDLTPGYNAFNGGDWMRDGKSIVVTGAKNLLEHPDRSISTSLYLVDAAGGGVKLFLEMKDYSLGNAVASPDGKSVAFTATPGEFLGYGQAAVSVCSVTGTDAKILTAKLGRTAGNLSWSSDSEEIYFVAPSSGGFPLYSVFPASGAVNNLSKNIGEDTGVRAYDVVKDKFVQVITTTKDPYQLYAGLRMRGQMLYAPPLATPNSSWLAGKKLSAVEPHSFTNKEGLTIQYWTMKPTEFDPAKKYPLLLQVHGGPQAMWGPGEDSMWFEFQYFAARGYAIVFCNPRGSGGYGFDFQHANFQDWGTGPASDILTSVDFAAKENYIDKNREVVTGGSYGGYMTAWLIGHDHRFKAAVAQRGVYHLPTFFGEANAWRLVPSQMGGYPWAEKIRPTLERESPFNYVDKITTPFLMQHGDNDRRTGFVQSEMMFKALKVMGRDVEEVRYPRATHEMSRSGEVKQRLDSLVRYEEFFRRYIGEN